jgi:glycolate oxidase
VVTEVTLQLLPLPRAVVTALLTFEALQGAAQAVTALLGAGVLPRTLELMDEPAVKAVDGKGFAFPSGTRAAVLLELDGDSEEPLMESMARAHEVVSPFGLREALVAQNEAQRRALWAARREVSNALRAIKPMKISEDIVVPRSRIPEMIERIQAIGQTHGVLVATYGHAGDGNLHANFLYESAEEKARAEAAVQETMPAVIALGGTITGEHGVGLTKRGFLPLEQPPELIALQKRLKALFDPVGVLNPGKIFA